MKVSDARKVLSGKLHLFASNLKLSCWVEEINSKTTYLEFSRDDLDFMLRQLALKTERAHKKAGE